MPSTNYKVEILKDISGKIKQQIINRRTFTFNTYRFKIINSSAFIERLNEDFVRIKIGLDFNYPVDTQEIYDKIKLFNSSGELLHYSVEPLPVEQNIQSFNDTFKTILVTETIPLSQTESYSIKIFADRSLNCIDGSIPLSNDYVNVVNLQSGKNLEITNDPKVESNTDESTISLDFSSPVETDELEDYIEIEPKVSYRMEEFLNTIFIKSNFIIGKNYKLSIKPGLTAKDGSKLIKAYSYDVTFEKLRPYLSFQSKGAFLSSQGSVKIAIETINLDEVAIEAKKVFSNNLVFFLHTNPKTVFANKRNYQYSEDCCYDYDYYTDYIYNFDVLGKYISQKNLNIKNIENKKIVTFLDLRELFNDDLRGIYQIYIKTKQDKHNLSDLKWVVITDIGLISKKTENEIVVIANSLSNLKPISDAKVSLLSKNNQVLATDFTNSDGIVKFSNLKKLEKDFEPYIIVAEKGNDISFIDFYGCSLPTSDFDIGGADVRKQELKGYIYFERDIYRPGETVNLVVIVRDKNNMPIPQIPVILEISDPQNNIIRDFNFNLSENGTKDISFDVPKYSKTGFYNARITIAENEIYRATFQIEDFLPDRIKVEILTQKDKFNKDDKVNVTVLSKYLFGSPSANKKVEASCEIISIPFTSKDFKDYTFSNEFKKFEKLTLPLGESSLDANGEKIFQIPIPKDIKPPSLLELNFSATVHEESGRSVTAYKKLLFNYYDYYIGIKQLNQKNPSPKNPVTFSYIVLNLEGQPVEGEKLNVLLFRRYWNTVWKRDSHGRYRYVSELSETLEDKKIVNSKKQAEEITFIPNYYGEYRIEINSNNNLASSSLKFNTYGWGYSSWHMVHPDILQLSLDKSLYKVGETAKLQVKSPYSGKLLIFLEREKIFSFSTYKIEENTAVIDIPILASYKPNIYVSAIVLNSVKTVEPQSSPRAFGIAPIMVDCTEKKLEVDINSQDEIEPNQKLKISISVKGANKSSFITVAGVDEGICQLTNFNTPDPFNHFYQKQSLTVKNFDIYSFVLPEVTQQKGGGEPGETLRRKPEGQSSLSRVKPVSLWSGIIKTDEEGKKDVELNIPQFNGNLRLMVVAQSDDKFGSSTKNVIVRQPIILMPTFPRFATYDDEITMPVVVFNGTDKKINCIVEVKTSENVSLIDEKTKKIDLDSQKEALLKFKMKIKDKYGWGSIKISAKSGNIFTEEKIDFPIRPISQIQTVNGFGAVSTSTEIAMPNFWDKNTDSYSLIITPNPIIKFASSLKYLIQYPYGCVEQTASSTFPLLYFKHLIKYVEPKLFKDLDVDSYVQAGIDRLISMQMLSGLFSYWPNAYDNYVHPWSSVYASHCLIEAKNSGYVIPNRVINRIKNGLTKIANLDSYDLDVRAYACYVLALMNSAEKSTMNYLRKEELTNLSRYAQALLAASYHMAGEFQIAKEVLPMINSPESFSRETGGNFNSDIRANAIILAALLQIDNKHPSIPILVDTLQKSMNNQGRWYTTQENAFALMALGKLFKSSSGAEYSGTVTVDDKIIASFSSKDTLNIEADDWAGKKIILTLKEKNSPAYFYWSSKGLRLDGKIELFDRRIKVRREFLNIEGNPVDLKSIKQGEILIAKVILSGAEKNYENIVIEDLLPAGFEVENPRLQTSKTIPWIKEENEQYKEENYYEDEDAEGYYSDSYYSRSNNNRYVDYVDIRDDKINIFCSLNYNQSKNIYYAVRAVNIGKFNLPPIKAEAMYDPDIQSFSSNGQVEVK